MTTIIVNGEPRVARPAETVADLIAERLGVRVATDGTLPRGVTLGIAVAVNAVVVPRAGWDAEEFADGDVVEVVSATQGG
ncbi:sulfur carrier protein ThiS [Microbacterium sp. B2969]|uniref:Sulfur carrier protein ThiS n=1 Tax=Microbacterium alkaliflavum TaxID=3248839 RepID=A0ABW7Q503_9MICO